VSHLYITVVGSKIPRLPGENFQSVLFRQVVTFGRRFGVHLAAEKAEAFYPVNPHESGFQPTAEPTGFQPVGGSVV
jgi:hypothetical protein